MDMKVEQMGAIVVFDIDGVIRDVGNSYRRALADTVAEFTGGAYCPTAVEIDTLKGEGIWNNDWEASQELIYRHFEQQGQTRSDLNLDYAQVVAYFQTKYRGTDSVNWNGYICNEPVLASLEYFCSLTAAHIPWGFFSGATTGSASYILERRLGLNAPILVAMEDAPGKPDPTGLFMAVDQLGVQHGDITALPIIYVGDTVADMQTIIQARQVRAGSKFIAIGVLPPHILAAPELTEDYRQGLIRSGATLVISNVQELTPELINSLI